MILEEHGTDDQNMAADSGQLIVGKVRNPI